MIRVVLQQPALPKYRLPVFRALAERPDIDLHVVYGEVPGLANVAPDGFRGTFIPQKYLKVGSREAIFHSPQIHYASRKRADVLILTWNLHYVTLVPALTRAMVAGVRTILWGHGYSRDEAASRSFLRTSVGKMADALLFYGDRTANAFADAGWSRERLFVARNSLDQSAIAAARESWLSRPDDLAAFRRAQALGPGPTLLFVSRLLPENRVDLLLAAQAKLVGKYPTLSAVLIGDGDTDSLRAQAASLGTESRVHFLGPIYDEHAIAPHFLTADAFVYPAKLGLSILHSFAYGLPLITSADPSAQMPERDALREGVNGLTYRDGDADDLARAIDEMLADPARRQRMADAALATSRDDYSVARMVDGFEAAIRAVVAKR